MLHRLLTPPSLFSKSLNNTGTLVRRPAVPGFLCFAADHRRPQQEISLTVHCDDGISCRVDTTELAACGKPVTVVRS
ncbi:MAG: hypothetical protein LUD84_03330, partial [Clostridiales bacterium]|nr:hypothetical protein [Clostridiales bacterium]